MFGNRDTNMHLPAGAPAAAGGGSLEYAGFWARVAALLVDWAILMIFSIVVLVGLSVALGGTGALIGNIIVVLAQFLYWPIMESSARQATFGKSLLGIEVTDADGRRTSFVRSLLRNLAKIISALPLGIGYLLAGLTARKQALHDMMTGCLVVRSGPSGFLKAAAAVIGGLALVAFGSYYYLFNIYVLQQTARTMKGGGGDIQREMERAMQGAGKNMGHERERAMAAARKEQQEQMEKARREAAKAPIQARPAPGPTAVPVAS
ncbi:MAG TPA: RDD family protein, partial [Burkholderiales bacterium]|nr:RDD family protein [Burkholderiales bacterium]